MYQTPVMVLNTSTKRETGRKAQITNILAAKVLIIHNYFLKILHNFFGIFSFFLF